MTNVTLDPFVQRTRAESGNAGGEVKRPFSSARVSRGAALLVENDGFAVLYFFEDGRCVKMATGAAESLRIIYRGQWEILTWGVCRFCGCTDNDCRSCIERTGAPCSWANDERTICSACARQPITAKATV